MTDGWERWWFDDRCDREKWRRVEDWYEIWDSVRDQKIVTVREKYWVTAVREKWEWWPWERREGRRKDSGFDDWVGGWLRDWWLVGWVAIGLKDENIKRRTTTGNWWSGESRRGRQGVSSESEREASSDLARLTVYAENGRI